jgi:hypothetical protein
VFTHVPPTSILWFEEMGEAPTGEILTSFNMADL